jgi:hypothetical protein
MSVDMYIHSFHAYKFQKNRWNPVSNWPPTRIVTDIEATIGRISGFGALAGSALSISKRWRIIFWDAPNVLPKQMCGSSE